jgi:hypothetical protein
LRCSALTPFPKTSGIRACAEHDISAGISFYDLGD